MRIILDFDGTLTDTEEEAKPCIAQFAQLFCKRFGITGIEQRIEEIKQQVLADPTRGWINNGKVVAPATADPYVLNTTIFTQLYDELGADPSQRDQALYELFTASYAKSGIAFRTGAAEFLGMLASHEVTIVTNSKTDAVEKKLAMLNASFPIVGNAKKYAIDDAFDAVPEALHIPGFPRPVLLRRKSYADILATGADVVIGDIFELDLALPQYLGFTTVQLAVPGTPAYEFAYKAPKRYIARDYEDILRMLG